MDAFIKNRSFRYQSSSPDPQDFLHEQADASDANPATEPDEDRLAALSYQVHQIGVEPDGSHRHHDQKLAEHLQRCEYRHRHAQRNRDGRDHGRQHKEQDEHREHLLELKVGTAAGRLFRAVERDRQRDRDNRERTRHLHDGRSLQRV